MPIADRVRLGALLSVLLLVASCRTADEPVPVAPASLAGAAPGSAAPFCPSVTLREGTGVLDAPSGYRASIGTANARCSLVGGQLRMEVAVAGTVTPLEAGAPSSANLPVRVAVVQGDRVLYSALGRQGVAIPAQGSSGAFTYVDNRIAFPVPSEGDVVVFAGFDEMS